MFHTNTSYAMLLISFLSGVASILVIIIFLSRPYLHKKPYFQIITYSSLANVFFSLSTSVGEIDDGSPLCLVQGLMSNIFPLSSIMWTLCATYLLYSNVVILKPLVIGKICHAACWGLPIVATCLIYTSNRIGEPQGRGWCFVANRSDSPVWSLLFWNIMSFYGWIILMIIYMGILIQLIRRQTRLSRKSSVLKWAEASNANQLSFTYIYVCPLIYCVCWILPLVVDTYGVTNGNSFSHNSFIYQLSITVPISQGLITSILFFFTNKYFYNILCQYIFLPPNPLSPLNQAPVVCATSKNTNHRRNRWSFSEMIFISTFGKTKTSQNDQISQFTKKITFRSLHSVSIKSSRRGSSSKRHSSIAPLPPLKEFKRGQRSIPKQSNKTPLDGAIPESPDIPQGRKLQYIDVLEC